VYGRPSVLMVSLLELTPVGQRAAGAVIAGETRRYRHGSWPRPP